MNRLERIRKMESVMNRVANSLENRSPVTPSLIQDIHVLEHYYQTEWLDDFQADERGELPEDLRRGILSEDSLYDLLCKADQFLSDHP